MTKLTPLLVAAGLLLSFAGRGTAGTISGQNPTGPYGPAQEDPYRVEQPQADIVRYLGSGFTQGSAGGTASRTLSFIGSFTNSPGEIFSALYNISVRLDQFAESGSFTFNLFVTPQGMAETQLIAATGPLNPTSDPNAFQNFSGSEELSLASTSGTYRGEITITLNGFSSGPSGDGILDGTPPPTATLRLDEIELQVAPIPEPSTYALVGVGLLALVYGVRRRRALA